MALQLSCVIGTMHTTRHTNHRGCRRPAYSHNQGVREPGAKESMPGAIGGFSMTTRPSEAAIDQIVESCNGDIRGALKALLLVNEHLEAELQQLYAAVAHGGPFKRGNNVLH
jgi:hypothetical protein